MGRRETTKMLQGLFIGSLLISFNTIQFSSALSCSCWHDPSPQCPKPMDSSDCASGETNSGMCGCCDGVECAKAEGETCGGSYGVYGACASYLQCVKDKKIVDPNRHEKGTCKSKKAAKNQRIRKYL